MRLIRLFLNEHKQQERLFAAFDYNKPINAIIKSIDGARGGAIRTSSGISHLKKKASCKLFN